MRLKFYGFFAAACALQSTGSLFYKKAQNDSSSVDFSLVSLTQNNKLLATMTPYLVILSIAKYPQFLQKNSKNFYKNSQAFKKFTKSILKISREYLKNRESVSKSNAKYQFFAKFAKNRKFFINLRKL